MSADREAFDLHNKHCRIHFKNRVKANYKHLWWWKLVWTDTINRVCSAREERG